MLQPFKKWRFAGHYLKNIDQRSYTTRSKLREYAKCYQILEIPNGSDQESVRKAFVNLCKKYHPDSGSSYANAEKFHEVSCVRFFNNKI